MQSTYATTGAWRRSLLGSPAGQEAIRRPVSGRGVLLALRRVPMTGDVADLVERTDREGGLPGRLDRIGAGGTE